MEGLGKRFKNTMQVNNILELCFRKVNLGTASKMAWMRNAREGVIIKAGDPQKVGDRSRSRGGEAAQGDGRDAGEVEGTELCI